MLVAQRNYCLNRLMRNNAAFQNAGMVVEEGSDASVAEGLSAYPRE